MRKERKITSKQTALTLGWLFVLGSVFGWLFELFVRRVDEGVWQNPGLLRGTYLPIYGCGLAALYLLAKLPLPIKNEAVERVVKIPLVGLTLTLIEYIGGLIFVKGMRMPLWDYSYAVGNVQGLICPLISFVWTALGGVYLLFLHKRVEVLEKRVDKYPAASVVLAFILGIMLADLTFALVA